MLVSDSPLHRALKYPESWWSSWQGTIEKPSPRGARVVHWPSQRRPSFPTRMAALAGWRLTGRSTRRDGCTRGLRRPAAEVRLRALVLNDLATLDAVAGEFDAACRGLEAALAIDESCRPARLNLELLVSRRCAPRRQARNGDEAAASAARSEPRPPMNGFESLGAGRS